MKLHVQPVEVATGSPVSLAQSHFQRLFAALVTRDEFAVDLLSSAQNAHGMLERTICRRIVPFGCKKLKF